MVAHGKQSDHQLLGIGIGIGIGQPGHVLVDGALDFVATFAQLLAQTLAVRIAELALLGGKRFEILLELGQLLAQASDFVGLSATERSLDRVEALVGERLERPKASTRVRGCTAKSLTAMRMAATAILKSRLASASRCEWVTVWNAWPTSRSPAR
ncbi:MAG: hypothetical protein P8Y53_04685 [Pseudolabrys sp.]